MEIYGAKYIALLVEGSGNSRKIEFGFCPFTIQMMYTGNRYRSSEIGPTSGAQVLSTTSHDWRLFGNSTW